MKLSYYYINCNRLFRVLWVLSGVWCALSCWVSAVTYFSHGYTLSWFSMVFPFVIFVFMLLTKRNIDLLDGIYSTNFSILGLNFEQQQGIYTLDKDISYSFNKNDNLYSVSVKDGKNNEITLINRIPTKRTSIQVLNFDLGIYN